jgi:hypothetical protein
MKIKRTDNMQKKLPAADCQIESYEDYVCMNFDHETLMLSYENILEIMDATVMNLIETIDKGAKT